MNNKSDHACDTHSRGQRAAPLDLTQGFFVRLMEKAVLQAADPKRGRFRSFLLVGALYKTDESVEVPTSGQTEA